MLINAGANLNAQDRSGQTALHYASEYSDADSSIETVKMLIGAGANVNIRDKNGRTSLIIATEYSNDVSNIKTVKNVN